MSRRFPVTASPSPTAATSPPTSPPPSTQAAGPIDVQDVSFVSADQGWAFGSGELVTTTDGGPLQMTLFNQQDLTDRPPGLPRRAACRLPHFPGSSPRSRGIGDLPPGGLLGARGGRCCGPGGIAGQRGYEPGTVQDVSLGSGGPHCRASASYYET